jgi:hypothetical protein
MKQTEPSPGGTSVKTTLPERREVSRIRNPFAVRVQGVNAAGEAFDEQTVLDNLSSGGAYLRLLQMVRPGTEFTITVQFAGAPISNHVYPGLQALGEVVRSEPQVGGACGVAVKFMQRSFLYIEGPDIKD